MTVIFLYNFFVEDVIMSYKNNAISSDDPKAVEKLTEKLNKCEKEQEFMKKVNAYYKKNGTVIGCEGVSDELADMLNISNGGLP